ncbi:hypothetical protein BGZ76_005689, partial [Entomortierella beljakovae]
QQDKGQSENDEVNASVQLLGEDECVDIDYQELRDLLCNIKESSHDTCEWMINDQCMACDFQKYQEISIKAMIAKEVANTDIADAMASFGVFAPFMPTKRMVSVFSRPTLEEASKIIELQTDDQYDKFVMKAVRHRLNNKRDEACDELRDIKDRKLRIMFEFLVEHLPFKKEKKISEETFVARFITPVLLGTLKADDKVSIDFPNTESTTQKSQSKRPDRPDIVARAYGEEILFGEVTGPCQENFAAKNAWDLYRISRYGKSLLDQGYSRAPLIQIVHSEGHYMRMKVKARGMFLLESMGSFVIPTSIEMVPSLLGTLQTLTAAQVRYSPKTLTTVH